MKIEFIETEGQQRDATVTFDAAEVSDMREKIIAKISPGAKIFGFRPGKVPRATLERHFSRMIEEETEKALNKKATLALGESNDRIIFILSSNQSSHLDSDGSWTFTLKVEFLPEVEVPDFTKIEMANFVGEENDDLLKQMAIKAIDETLQYRSVKRSSQISDAVSYQYVCCLADGTPVAEKFPQLGEGIAWGSTRQTLGIDYFNRPPKTPLPYREFVGLSVGDRKDIAFAFGEDCDPLELAGCSVIYRCTIIAVEVLGFTWAPQTFENGLSALDIERMRKDVIERHRTLKGIRHRMEMSKVILSFLVDLPAVPMPKYAYESEVQFALKHLEDGKYFLSELIDDAPPKQKEQRETFARNLAEKALKVLFIIENIARKEKVSVDANDLFRTAMLDENLRTRSEMEKYLKNFSENSDDAHNMRRKALTGKVIEKIMSQLSERYEKPLSVELKELTDSNVVENSDMANVGVVSTSLEPAMEEKK
ncbi:MAG: hypothetical protein LBI69_01530 [Puniceicoccales bacterium]|nr:hypothetical protein [Puniceicoccales bacterium]